MKNSNLILTALVALALTVSSCKKHDKTEDPTPTPNPTGNTNPTISATHSTPLASRPDSVLITAIAADVDGSIVKVEFIRNSIVEATVTASPFSYRTTGLAVGSYSYTIKCYDNKGATATTTENFTVTAYTPVNASPVFTATTKSIVADGNQKNFALPVTDAENDIMTITSITGGSANVTITYNNANVSITPANKLYCGVENLTISVTDGNTTTTSSFTVTLGGTGQIASYNILKPYLDRVSNLVATSGQYNGTLYLNSNGTATSSMNQPVGEFYGGASTTGTYYLNSSGYLIVTAGYVTTYQVTIWAYNGNDYLLLSKQNNGTQTYAFN